MFEVLAYIYNPQIGGRWGSFSHGYIQKYFPIEEKLRPEQNVLRALSNMSRTNKYKAQTRIKANIKLQIYYKLVMCQVHTVYFILAQDNDILKVSLEHESTPYLSQLN